MMALAFALAIVCAATAHAANYKMVLCAANNGSNSFDTATNTRSAENPNGIFSFENHCGPAPDPAGEHAFLRIAENQGGGNAALNAYGSISWTVPPWVEIRSAGGYTREPNAFNNGWRGRFWAEDWGGGTNNILMQGTEAANEGINWSPTSVFASHLWPFGGYGNYRRFVFELTCFRQAGCDRSNFNAVDANTMVLVLADVWPSQVWLTNTDAPLLGGRWVRGTQIASYAWSELGSGIRTERIRIDGAERYAIDHHGDCDTGYSEANQEFARSFKPCPEAAGIGRSFAFDTASLPDGAHTLQACTQDYAQWKGLDATGGESCDARTIRTDNTAPGKPAELKVTSANPERYLDHFGARFSLPPDPGSPIAKVHYEIVNASGQMVVPEKVLSGANPTSLAGIEGPPKADSYSLRVWLEDQVGFRGPAAEAPIPHDTKPPAAPQELRVVASTAAHRVERFGLRWQNTVDAGAPIDTAHYRVLNGAGEVIGGTRAVSAENIERIADVQSPQAEGDYTVRVWLSDQEGNVGAASTVPLPRDTTPPAAPQQVSVTAPGVSRASDGFDVRWRNITDDGSPIVAAHYRVYDAGGSEVVPTTTVNGPNIEAVPNLKTPRERGVYTLVLWLSDAEGNVGAPIRAPLSYSCVRGEERQVSGLSARLGKRGDTAVVVRQGRGATLAGQLNGAGGPLANAPICVFDQVMGDATREFMGVALTDANGEYRLAVPAGPSRTLTAVHRIDQREVAAQATLRTRVRPTFRLLRKVVRNKGFALFESAIPGPHKQNVVIVLQVKSGKGWRAFRRCHTRASGRCLLRYRLTRTPTPTVYIMRAQVRAQSGFPYLQGSSKARRLRVVPQTSRARRARSARSASRARPARP